MQENFLYMQKELKGRFNWGAFLLSWIWGLFHKKYITLIIIPIAFIPKIGGLLALIAGIYFGFKGNSWALENKKFTSVEQFNKYQCRFVVAAVIIMIVSMIIFFFKYQTSMLYTPSELNRSPKVSEDYIKSERNVYAQMVQKNIYKNLSDEILSGKYSCAVQFQIDKQGNVSDILLEKGTGTARVDDLIINAIKNSAPFEPFKYYREILIIKFELSPTIIDTKIIRG